MGELCAPGEGESRKEDGSTRALVEPARMMDAGRAFGVPLALLAGGVWVTRAEMEAPFREAIECCER